MRKLHQLLPNVAFFLVLGLIYFNLPSWANLLACVILSVYVYFDEIKEETALKYALKHFGSMLLFIPLAYSRLDVLVVGVFPFLLGFAITHTRLTNFSAVVSRLYLLLIVCSVLGFYLPKKLTQLQTHTELNEITPEFQIKNFKTKEYLSKNDLKGKIVIVNFWATWCGTCIKEMGPLNKIYETYKDNPEVLFLAVNTQKWSADNEQQIEHLIKRKNITMPVYIDFSNEMTEGFDVSSIPTLFILDKKGNMRARHIGFSGEDNLEKYLLEQINKL